MKYWVFDLDGTLVDSFSQFFDSMTEIFAEIGEEFTARDKQDTLSMPLSEWLKRRVPGGPHEFVLSEIQNRSIAGAMKVRVFPGVENCLRELAGAGHEMAIWTGRDISSANKLLEVSGLGKYFGLRVGGSCTPKAKPAADGLRLIMSRLNCAGHEVVMIGDHEHDVLAARELGALGIRASWNGFSGVESCAHSYKNFTEVSQFHGWLKVRNTKSGG